MNKVRIPKIITKDIAYLAGFISGDGHLCFRKDKHEYSIFCSGNLENERIFYESFIKNIFIRIFNIVPKTRINIKNKTITLVVYSKNLLFYFSKVCEIPIGAKSGKVRIPNKFKNFNTLKKAFIQGFVDADFSLCLKKRYRIVPYYPVISGSSKSKIIISEIADFLKSCNISFSLNLNAIQYDKRFKKGSVIMHSVHVYGKKNLFKWMKIIGFRNNKYVKIFEKLR